MINILTEIRAKDGRSNLTKHDKITSSIMQCIKVGDYSIGDQLPSVNELSAELSFSRETVVKAYKELKERGIISSKQGLGYFVSSNNASQKHSVALVLYGFQAFQQDFYNTFRKTLGKDYKIDVFFHHNNFAIYNSILDSILGNYSQYVVAPIQSEEAEKLISNFQEDRLLIIDRYQYISEHVSNVTQEFEQSLLRVFEELNDSIRKYNKITMYYRENSDYPIDIYNAAIKYCKEHQLLLEVKEEFSEEDVEVGNLFFTIGDSDLWEILKYAKENNFKIGKDIGILSHNDSPVKEIIEGGITTFSTDFKTMAQYSAEFVMNREHINKIIPSLLIRRKSL